MVERHGMRQRERVQKPANRASEVIRRQALEAGLLFRLWREALSSEEPVGGASETGVMDGGVVVAVFTPQILPNTCQHMLSFHFCPKGFVRVLDRNKDT